MKWLARAEMKSLPHIATGLMSLSSISMTTFTSSLSRIAISTKQYLEELHFLSVQNTERSIDHDDGTIKLSGVRCPPTLHLFKKFVKPEQRKPDLASTRRPFALQRE